MQIVIEIPEGTKRAIDMGTINQVLTSKVWAAIKNGTPLPKHHGDLGDLNAVYDDFRQHYFDNPTVMRCAEIVLGNVPTIIPATKESE